MTTAIAAAAAGAFVPIVPSHPPFRSSFLPTTGRPIKTPSNAPIDPLLPRRTSFPPTDPEPQARAGGGGGKAGVGALPPPFDGCSGDRDRTPIRSEGCDDDGMAVAFESLLSLSPSDFADWRPCGEGEDDGASAGGDGAEEAASLYRDIIQDLTRTTGGIGPGPSPAGTRPARPPTAPGPAEGSDVDGGESPPLIPEPNPHAEPHATSLSNVSYSAVLRGLEALYPPADLMQRNAVSRSDGYWRYVDGGLDPPLEFTYGEFDLHFFASLLDRAWYHWDGAETEAEVGGGGDSDVDSDDDNGDRRGWEGRTFVDIGSGSGRLVLAAAALHPGLKLSRGLEVLPGLHHLAGENLSRCHQSPDEDENREEKSSDVGSAIGARRNALWGINANEGPKRNDEDWLNGFAGTLLGDGGGAAEVGFVEDEEEEEWRNPDDWIGLDQGKSDLKPADDFVEVDVEDGENDEDTEWRSADTWGDSFSSVSFSEGGEEQEDANSVRDYGSTQNVVDKDLSLKDMAPANEYYLQCPSCGEEEQTQLPLGPVEFVLGSFEDPYMYLGDVDIAFIFASCMGPDLLDGLSRSVGRQMRPGTVVITTEFPLPLEGKIMPSSEDDDVDPNLPLGQYQLEILEVVEGWCWLTGGSSTAYMHRVVKSLWEEGSGPRERPKPSAGLMARDVVMKLEMGELTDVGKFLRQVRNNMAFHGLPEGWIPNIEDVG